VIDAVPSEDRQLPTMQRSPHDLGGWSNARFTQAAALMLVLVGVVCALAFNLASGIAVWSVAVVFFIGSFFIERDFGPAATERDDQ
jgi:hypothetical protein